MPLLLICGSPGSGKTTRARELLEFFKTTHNAPCSLINEEELNIDKQQGYLDSKNEKMTRGYLKSNAEKVMSKDRIVIFDSMNYIKGYRYELYCLARSAQTTNCVLYLNTAYEICKEQAKSIYSEELFEDLYKRMEKPKQKDRWDSPYFEVRHNEKTPLAEIADTLLFQQKKAKDPTATKLEQIPQENFVQESEKRIQQVIEMIMNQQNEALNNQNGVITFEKQKYKLQIPRVLSLIELKKLRLEFTNILRINPITNINQIQEGFVNFLQSQMERL